jgi:hypothetical protein
MDIRQFQTNIEEGGGLMKTNRSERNLDQSELGDFALPRAMKCNYLSRRVSSKQWNVLLGLLVEKLLRGYGESMQCLPNPWEQQKTPSWNLFAIHIVSIKGY